MANHFTEEKIRKLASLNPKLADTAWFFYLGAEGEERGQVDDLLDVMLFQEAQKDYREKVFLDPPLKQQCEGEYRLGRVLYPPGKAHCSFGLREDDWIKHVLICGMTGMGKTNTVLCILRELKEQDKPFLIFDWKRSYRDLLQIPAFKDLKVFTVARDVQPFKFNPLIPPPGTGPGQWIMKLVDVLNHSFFGGQGTEYLLREGIDAVYEECGLFEEGVKEVPTFEAVRAKVKARHVRGRMQLWKASAMRMLESLCFEHGLGQVVLTTKDFDYKSFLDCGVVLELDALSDADKVFLVEAMILWIYEFRKNSGKRERFEHALILEEAHHVLGLKKENVEGAETIMETCLRQIRELGEAVICVDQEPSKLSNSIKANTNCKMTFALGHGKDVYEMSRSMCLTQEETDFLDWLRVGEAVVTLKGRSLVPLHVQFDKYEIRKGLMTDERLRKRSA